MMVAVLNPMNERKLKLKLKQEEFEQGRVLERGKDAQTPLAAVSLRSNEMSLGSNENLDARSRDENLARADNKFLEVVWFVFRSWCNNTTEKIESYFR